MMLTPVPPNGGKLQTIIGVKRKCMDKEQFKKLVHSVMKENGFHRKGNSWYKATDECIVLLNLQHSLYSSLYYINLACMPQKFAHGVLYPKEECCFVRTRIPKYGINGENYHQITDLETEINDSERESGIIHILRDYCLPTLDKFSSIKDVKQFYSEEPYLNDMMRSIISTINTFYPDNKQQTD